MIAIFAVLFFSVSLAEHYRIGPILIEPNNIVALYPDFSADYCRVIVKYVHQDPIPIFKSKSESRCLEVANLASSVIVERGRDVDRQKNLLDIIYREEASPIGCAFD